MTAADIRDLIIRQLVRAQGGGTARWRGALGELKVYPLETHAHCNWDVRPSGSAFEMAQVERAADVVRARYPFVEK
jgi:hypothetical protein